MNKDGRSLEALVAYIEKHLQPQGLTVTSNQKVYDEEDGVQLAELDVVVEGVVDGKGVRWLIECRDRPSDGAAGVGWVEQLIGRKITNRFDRVSAVSASGFSRAAMKVAEQNGIELREIRSVDPAEFVSWLQIQSVHEVVYGVQISHLGAQVDLRANPSLARRLAARPRPGGRADVFIRCKDGARLTGDQIVIEKLKREGAYLIDDLDTNPLPFDRVYVFAPGEFDVDTGLGLLPLQQLSCSGHATKSVKEVPIQGHATYGSLGAEGNMIAQLASANHALQTGDTLGLDFRMLSNGDLHLFTRIDHASQGESGDAKKQRQRKPKGG